MRFRAGDTGEFFGFFFFFFGGVLLQMCSCALPSLWKGRLRKDICAAVSLLSRRAPCNCPMLEENGLFIIFKHQGGKGEKLIFFFLLILGCFCSVTQSDVTGGGVSAAFA